jgi:hypothetical protein
VYDTQMQGVMLMQALSEPRMPWRINSEIGDMAGVCVSGTPLLDYQRIDIPLDTKPRLKNKRDPAPPMTALERLIGRELSAEMLEEMDLLANGKPENMNLLLEVGMAAGKTFASTTYPDPKFDLPDWKATS